MLPVLQAIGAGLTAVSALKNLTSGSHSAAATNTAKTGQPVATNTAPHPAASNSGAPTTSEMQDRFLKLLVTQMKNQDPLNPLDNAQVTTQMAQISTVGGIDKLNDTLKTLSSSMLASRSMQSASIIGRQVYATGSYLHLTDGKASGGIDLKQDADRVFVSIADSSGAVVRTLQLGPAKAGISAFEWDGMTDAGTVANPGSYVFQITAGRGSAVVSAEPLTIGRVGGISIGNAMKLNLENGGELGMGDVKRII